ncbi:MAG: efflux RND transporter permease subunit [Planctomycetota bacterium]
MLDWIIRTALGNRLIVVLTALAIAVFGTLAALRMPIDVLPDLDRPVVTLIAEAPGTNVEDIELLVARPLEQALNGAPGIARVRSISSGGVAVLYAEFDWSVDPYRARQVVAEKLQLAELPRNAHVEMAPLTSIMGQILVAGFRAGDRTDRATLRRIVERDVKPRLLAQKGVAQVVVNGALPTELQVTADSARLRAFDVTLEEVRDAVVRANVSVVGSVMPEGPTAPLVGVRGRLDGPDQLAAAIVRDDPRRPVRIGDVAEVTLGPAAIAVGEAGVDGRAGVLVVVTKQPGTDTLELTKRLRDELAAIAPGLPSDVTVLDGLFRQADFIERALDNVGAAVRDGALLVLIVLFLFLLDLRTTLITLTAIPLSVAVTAIVFALFGLGIDTMTLGGLAVAIGTLVDDAIVDVENVYRRLWENGRRATPRAVAAVVLDAAREVRKPVTYGTLLVTVVYLPLFFLSGIEGRLFAPIGVSYIVSVMASLVVALTVTPVLCVLLLGRRVPRSASYGGRLVAGLRALAARVASFGIAHCGAVLGVLAACTLCAAAVVVTRGTTFLPPFQEGTLQVNLSLPPEASLATSDAFGQRLERMLMAVPGVAHVARRSGRGEGDAHIDPITDSECIVVLDPHSGRSREAIMDDVRDRLRTQFPGLPTETEQPLAHLLSHLLSGVTSQVAIKISGPDLDRLRALAQRVEGKVKGIDGVVDLATERIVEVPQIEIAPQRERLAQLGVSVDTLATTVGLALGGEEVSRLRDGSLTIPIRVRLRPDDRADLDGLRALLLRGHDDDQVRLGDVADVRRVLVPNEIRREGTLRRIVVKHNVAGRALGDVVADVQQALAPIRAELAAVPGYSLELSGQFEAQQEATRTILALSLVALAAMMLILFLHFRSIPLAALVLLTRPIAFLGGVGAVVATGQDLSVAALVGFIALLGMAVRNAILLVDHTLHLLREEGAELSIDTILRAVRERIVPVLMTALTSGIGLLPLALGAGQPGRELLYPVATVVIGGLVTNTLLDFVLVPGLMWHLTRSALSRAAAAG